MSVGHVATEDLVSVHSPTAVVVDVCGLCCLKCGHVEVSGLQLFVFETESYCLRPKASLKLKVILLPLLLEY